MAVGAATGIPATRYANRLGAAREALRREGAAALLVGVGAELQWLTGYQGMPTERLTMLVLPMEGEVHLVAPRLEAAPAGAAPAVANGAVELVTWTETEDPAERVASLLPDRRARLLVSDRLWAMFLLRLQAACPAATTGLASEVLRTLRMVKDADEVALLRRAAQAADRALLAIAHGRLVGRSEADVAREVRQRLVDEGHEQAAFAIVGSGPYSASPHHEPGERVIQAGEPVVLDIGGTVGGYYSDITRTVWVAGADGAGPGDDFRHLYAVVHEAQQRGSEAVRPGVACSAIDAAARGVIEAAGMGAHFIHRTGHGIGLEGHEDPYLVAGNDEPLPEGSAFSVEPGIYLEGRHGARIEDIVVCGPDGPDVLNEAPRELLVVGG
ncbi:MAG TPA: Xaa-Pro peptidase family protein [Candidatus Limnocylindrales bacterium]|nr:Xaa-Pro peptidase family protein [Candidatus Limnocylindrales bacterium]